MQERLVYLDHGATSPLREEVLEAMLPFLKERYGNPSSLHSPGRVIRQAVEEAREKTALALGAEPDEIFFTSGGTESNNIAIRGAARARRSKGHLITTSIEHHAVLDVCKGLAEDGFSVTYLPVDRYGLVSLEMVEKALRPDTFMISIMMANNEVGTIEPVAEIGALARERGVLFHTDAVQAVGQIPLDLRELKIDLLTLSAHKFNGPKGVGALYVRRGTPVAPLYDGGGQEKALRPGTENIPGIVGLARALELAVEELPEKTRHLLALRRRLIEGLQAIDDTVLNGHPPPVFRAMSTSASTILRAKRCSWGLTWGIAASSGSACTAGSPSPPMSFWRWGWATSLPGVPSA